MKNKVLLIAIVFAGIIAACTNEENQEVTTPSSKKWEQSTLTTTFFKQQENTSHYNFNKSELQSILNKEGIHKFRFVLGLEESKLQITAVGVDINGKILGNAKASTNTAVITHSNSIASLKSSSLLYAKTKKTQPIVGKHLLSYKDAYNYVTNWQEAIKTKDVEDFIRYDGVRIRYFAIEKEVITAMVKASSVNQIALFLGLNTANKLTTVFMQKNTEGKLIFKNSLENTTLLSRSEGAGFIYDFTDPCPELCDENNRIF